MKQLNKLFSVLSAKPLMLLTLFALLPTLASAQCPDNNHPHMIDLGLPSGTKWACCNVGAQKPEDYGGYYAWGETEIKDTYSWSNYVHCDGTMESCHYLGADIAGTNYDVAHSKWGASWLMPNQEQMKELVENCQNERTVENGILGRKFTGPNGKAIFLPAAGQNWNGELSNIGKSGNYYSSNSEHINCANLLTFYVADNIVVWDNEGHRAVGWSVRPVATTSSRVTVTPTDLTLKVGGEDGVINIIPEDTYFYINSVNQSDDGGQTWYPVYAPYIDVTKEDSRVVIHPKAAGSTGFRIVYYEDNEWKSNFISIYVHAENTFTSMTEEGVEMTFQILDESNKTCEATSRCVSSQTKGKVTVPSEANGYKVVGIGSGAFSNLEEVTEIVISEGVEYIRYNYAFEGCTNLRSIYIPKTVTSMGYALFENCESLSSIVVDADNPVFDSRDNCNAIIMTSTNAIWSSCPATEIPATVTEIHYAFQWIPNLTSIYVPENITKISDMAFRECRDLKEIIFAKSIANMGWSIDMDNSSLEKITVLDENPCEIGEDVFSCYNTATLYVPAGCKAKYEATAGWNKFQNIVENFIIDFADPAVKAICVANWDTNGDGELSSAEATAVTDLGTVFKNNADITSFDELQYFTGLTGIETGAFAGSSLTSIIIPKSVISISESAFNSCSSLASIKVDNGNTKYDSRGDCNAIIETETNTLVAGCMNTVIPNSVTSIGNQAFINCTGLKSIDIPNSVTNIKEAAFYGSGLTSVTIPNSVTTIDMWAFGWCRDLVTVNIGNSVTTIGDMAFYLCDALTSVTIPSSVTTIGSDAFGSCSSLASIKVESGNAKYDSRDDCNAIIETETNTLIKGCNNTIIPNSVTTIGEFAFISCSSLTSMTIPNSVNTIGWSAFGNCTGLTSVIIPNSVTSIEKYAFSGCIGLTSITVKSGNNKYDSRDNCNAIIETANNTLIAGCMNTIIPNTVTTIGENAFDYCISLTSVTIPSSVTSIEKWAFYGCEGLIEVRSMITEPFEINPNCWEGVNTDEIPLYVPAGTKEKYEATAGWNVFKNIVEMDMAPIENGETINIGDEIDENTNLDGNVVDNVFVNISNGDGGFDPVEGCLIVSKPTDDSAINGQDIFGDDFKDNYTGIVFKVNEGKGSIKVEAETQGNMVLKVKIGNNDPIEMELNGKLKVKFPYNVSEETLVYIYGGLSDAAGAKGTRVSTDGNDLLKIYGFEIVSDQSGIEAVDNGQQTDADAPIYNLNGQRVNKAAKGVFIKNGRKVLVK